MKSGIRIGGKFNAKYIRNGKVLYDDTFYNVVTNEGLNHLLNSELHAAATIGTWYLGLVETDTTATTALTYAVPSYTESTAYDEALRVVWNEAAAASQSITNAGTVAVFTISATKTIYGACLVGGGTAGSTKADSAGGGTLFCYAKAATSRAVIDNDVINLTYALTAADDGV